MSKPLDELLLETLGKKEPGVYVPMQNLFQGPNGYEFTTFGAFEKALLAYKKGDAPLFSVGRKLVELRRAYHVALAEDADSPITSELYDKLNLACKFTRIVYNRP